MVKIGKVYQNLMVDMQATNIKLVDRARRMVCEATGCDAEQAETALLQVHYEVKTAILMILADLPAEQAKQRLTQHKGFLRAALSNE